MKPHSANATSHRSVLVKESLFYLNIKPNSLYIDVTFGAGGHTRAILESNTTCKVIAIDWDKQMLEQYGVPLQEEFGDRIKLVWGNFALLYKLLKNINVRSVDGILADFGTSQVHIFAGAGFSVYKDTPLDMRMSPAHQKITAAELLQTMSESDLRDLFWKYGEERHAKRIAHAIVQERLRTPFKTTGQLARLIERLIPKKELIHPATRIFQALRIYINKELDNINSFLSAALSFLVSGGRLVCISFHSLEDRLVKQFFKEQAVQKYVSILTPKVVRPSLEEIRTNLAARSARLRAIEKL